MMDREKFDRSNSYPNISDVGKDLTPDQIARGKERFNQLANRKVSGDYPVADDIDYANLGGPEERTQDFTSSIKKHR